MMTRPPENVFPLRPRTPAPDSDPGARHVPAGRAALIVDDEAVYRDGMKALLLGLEGMTQVFEASTAAEAIALARSLPPLGLIVAKFDPQDNGSAIARLRHHFRGTSIAAVAHRHDRASVASAFRQGAHACLNRVTGREVTRLALSLALSGEGYVPAELCWALGSGGAEADAPPSPAHPPLGQRQAEVLHLMLEGRTNKEIARGMGVLESTVKSHVKAVLRALGAGNRTQAVIIATRLGWRPKNL